MSSKKNGASYICHDDFSAGMNEMIENIIELQAAFNALKLAVNTQGEVAGLHRFVLEKFVPLPLLEAASKEYYALRQREIASATAPMGNA